MEDDTKEEERRRRKRFKFIYESKNKIVIGNEEFSDAEILENSPFLFEGVSNQYRYFIMIKNAHTNISFRLSTIDKKLYIMIHITPPTSSPINHKISKSLESRTSKETPYTKLDRQMSLW